MTFEIVASADAVRAWSDVRLPFEPKGDARVFRDQLRDALRGLARRPVLHAQYVSADDSPCDVENITLYNLGVGAFAGLGTQALVVERPRARSPRAPSGAPRPHFLAYRVLTEVPTWTAWRPRRKLVAWHGAQVRSPLTATSVWASLKAGEAEVVRAWDGSSPLGITVSVASDRTPSLVNAVKALLDGVVAAGHAHDRDDLVEMAAHLALKLRVSPQGPLAWLSDRAGAVLGSRRLLHARAGGVQWNPADDHVVAFTVTREVAGRAGTSIAAEVWTVRPATIDRAAASTDDPVGSG